VSICDPVDDIRHIGHDLDIALGLTRLIVLRSIQAHESSIIIKRRTAVEIIEVVSSVTVGLDAVELNADVLSGNIVARKRLLLTTGLRKRQV